MRRKGPIVGIQQVDVAIAEPRLATVIHGHNLQRRLPGYMLFKGIPPANSNSILEKPIDGIQGPTRATSHQDQIVAHGSDGPSFRPPGSRLEAVKLGEPCRPHIDRSSLVRGICLARDRKGTSGDLSEEVGQLFRSRSLGGDRIFGQNDCRGWLAVGRQHSGIRNAWPKRGDSRDEYPGNPIQDTE